MRIELANVRKSFGRTQVLRGIDLTIPAGRRVALIGPNGSGKSTLTRVILGLLACEGEVRLDGFSPFRDRVRVASRLAYVPQTAPALAAPVGDVVRLAATVRGLPESRFEEACRELELDLGAIRGRPFRNLSGGMKQKLLLALAFASDPSLLILDEPTASLDAAARERFLGLMDRLPEGTTVILSSHRLDEVAQLAGHVIALDEGRLAHDGAPEPYLARRTSHELQLVTGGRHA